VAVSRSKLLGCTQHWGDAVVVDRVASSSPPQGQTLLQGLRLVGRETKNAIVALAPVPAVSTP
jgi:hypothetical protein